MLPQAYQTFMKDSAQLFGAPSPDAAKFAIDMFNFEKRIAEITPGSEYMNNPLKVNNKMKVSNLQLWDCGMFCHFLHQAMLDMIVMFLAHKQNINFIIRCKKLS